MERTHTFSTGQTVTYDDERYGVKFDALFTRDFKTGLMSPNPYPCVFHIDGVLFRGGQWNMTKVTPPVVRTVSWQFEPLQNLWVALRNFERAKNQRLRGKIAVSIWSLVCKCRREYVKEYNHVSLLTIDIYRELDPGMAWLATLGYLYGNRYNSAVRVTLNSQMPFFIDGKEPLYDFDKVVIEGQSMILMAEQDAYLIKLKHNLKVYDIGKWARSGHGANKDNLTLANAAVD